MRVLMVSHGSTGDIYPMIGLGRALIGAGHAVTFATARVYEREIREAGLAFSVSPPDWDAEGHAELMRELVRERYPWRNVATIYRRCAPHLKAFVEATRRDLAGHDLLVSSYLYPFLSPLAHEAGKRIALVAFCHAGFPGADFAPAPLPAGRCLPRALRHAWADAGQAIADTLVRAAVDRACGAAVRAAGLRMPRRFFSGAADLTLAPVSPGLFAPERPAHAGLVYSGYLRHTPAFSAGLESRLESFCGGDRVPVLNFGSVTADASAELIRAFLSRWPAGERLILQSGWAGFRAENRPEILVIEGKVSHEQLFRRASVVAHHGGAGTTAAVLHSGAPQVVVPHIGDQFFWASEMRRLGVAAEVSSRRWPEDLPGALRRVPADRGCVAKAARCAGILAAEDGAACAVAALERLVRA